MINIVDNKLRHALDQTYVFDTIFTNLLIIFHKSCYMGFYASANENVRCRRHSVFGCVRL